MKSSKPLRSMKLWLSSALLAVTGVIGLLPVTAQAATAPFTITSISASTTTMQNATVYTITGVDLPSLTDPQAAKYGGTDYQNIGISDGPHYWGIWNAIQPEAYYGITVSVSTSTEIQFTAFNGGSDNATQFSLYLTPANQNASIAASDQVASYNLTTASLTTYYNQSVLSQVNLVPGSLSLTAPTIASPFPAIVLNGITQNTYATLSPWTIIDATGSGNGWNVQVQASQFTELAPSSGFASGTSALTLPQGSLSLTGSRTIVANSGSSPVDATGGPLFTNTNPAIDVTSPVNFIQASAGYGLGGYQVQEPTNGLMLTLNPSSTKVDSTNYPGQPTPYQSVITFSVVSGP